MKRKIIAISASALLIAGTLSVNCFAQGPVPDFNNIKATTVPQKNTTTGDNAPSQNVPSENPSSNTSNSGQKKVIVQFPDIKGDKVSDEEALKVLKESATALDKLESYETDTVTAMKILEEDIVLKTRTIQFPKLHESKVIAEVAGNEVPSYYKEGKIYQMNPETREWQFLNVGVPDNTEPKEVTVDPQVLEFCSVEKLSDGGYVIKIPELIPLEKAMLVFPSDNQQSDIANLKNIMGEDTNMTLKMTAVVNPDMTYKNLFMEYSIKVNDPDNTEFKTFVQYSYSKYNEAEPIVLPEEVKNAKEVEIPANPGERAPQPEGGTSSETTPEAPSEEGGLPDTVPQQ